MKVIINSKIISLVLAGLLLLAGCDDEVLDKTDLSLISEDAVFNDPGLALANLSRIYLDNSPGWPVGASGNSDDAPGEGDFIYGRLVDDSNRSYEGQYQRIRRINVFLEGLESGSIEDVEKDPMIGQALFFRAWAYWLLVRTYGGVPIVLETRDRFTPNVDAPRNSTSETVTQIITDFDNAIALLPDSYGSSDFGRITKGTAMAVKGRVLMHYASEHFDPNQSQGRWQAAYDALAAAKTNLDANGKGLNSSYSNLWFDDGPGNPEIIWNVLFNADRFHSRDASVRQFQPGFGGGRIDNATISLLDSYPMRDGKAISDNTSTYTYDPLLIWKNRDPRFEATMAWNGAIYPVEHPSPFKTSDLSWSFQFNPAEREGDAAVTLTGFLNRKAVDLTLDNLEARESTVQWIEMRYAELLLNLAEAANETGRGSEALNVLFDIRQRAGIENNDGRYGLEAGLEGDQSAMREAILLERRIELAFEGKRSVDLVRRRRIEDLNGTRRRGYFITRTDMVTALAEPAGEYTLDDRLILEDMVLDGTIDLDDPAVYEMYFTTETYNVEEGSAAPGGEGTAINFQERYYFFDIPRDFIDRNTNLEQTIGWPGGAFDPLL